MLQVLLVLSISSLIHATEEDSPCPVSSCGDLSLNYPFKLPNTQPQNNCTYIDLSCNKAKNTPVVSLPYAGDFYVRSYSTYDTLVSPYIQLYDPGKCLMKRLMNNLNLSSSPFEAIMYYDYTFYACPNDAGGIIGGYILPIDCLSNSSVNSTTVAATTSSVSPDYMLEYNCSIIGSWLLPVTDPFQFEINVDDDLYLTWTTSTCDTCEDDGYDVTGVYKENGSWTTYPGSLFVVLTVLFEHLLLKTIF